MLAWCYDAGVIVKTAGAAAQTFLLALKCKAKLSAIHARNTQNSTFDIEASVSALVSMPSAPTPIAAAKKAMAQPNIDEPSFV